MKNEVFFAILTFLNTKNFFMWEFCHTFAPSNNLYKPFNNLSFMKKYLNDLCDWALVIALVAIFVASFIKIIING